MTDALRARLCESPAMARVLVIDDVLESVNLITMVLQADGHECQAVSSPAQAFTLMAQKPYDLLITDQNMPGMTGEAVIERVRAQWPNTKYLMLTADPRIRDDEGRGYPVMHKPFRLPVLRAMVKDLVGAKK